MGLESVELVMAVEDRFGTSLPERELENLRTVGDLYDFVMQRIRHQNGALCASASTFYQIRHILVGKFDVDRTAVRTATPLDELVNSPNRKRFWDEIASVFSWDLPRLVRSRWLQWNGDVFPSDFDTVKKLVKWCVERNQITDEFGLSDAEAVWDEVCKLVADVAGIDVSGLDRETSFVDHLGF
ncbi:MAG: phosphopantetheine-binding protein [Planctomycetota bacterium]